MDGISCDTNLVRDNYVYIATKLVKSQKETAHNHEPQAVSKLWAV